MDWKKDIANSLTYMSYAKILLEGRAKNGLLQYLIKERFGKDVICLGRDDSFMIGGFELAHHGDLGANGSRGNLKQFARTSTPLIIGDSHTPSRVDDAFQVGTASLLRCGYNEGSSSWLHCDAIIHNDNKCQLIIYINNDFTNLPI